MRDIKKRTNELIKIRKKKKAIRRSIFFTLITVVAIVILCLKHPYFNIGTIQIVDNSLVSSEEIEKLSDIKTDSNIFLLEKNEVKEKILQNPYISEVVVKRKLPSTVSIGITERTPKYYSINGKEYVLTDATGYILEVVESIKGLELIQLSGIDAAVVPGSKIVSDEKKINQIKVFSDLIDRNLSEVSISVIELQSNSDIKVYFNNIMVKVGSIDAMENKLNKAINIITQQNIKNANGYIDVSFNGDPVISIKE